MARFLTVAAVAAMLLTATVAQGVVLAKWTFETSVPTTAGPHAAEEGVFGGNATGFHSNVAAVYSNPVGNGTGESFSSNNWLTGDYYQFETSTLGYNDIEIQFDQTRSSTGSGTFDLLISTDGSNWAALLQDYSIDAISWSSGTYKPESTFGPYAAPALDNQATVYIRLLAKVDASGTAGSNRVDNVTVTPEPVTLTLLGLGGLLFARRRRA